MPHVSPHHPAETRPQQSTLGAKLSGQKRRSRGGGGRRERSGSGQGRTKALGGPRCGRGVADGRPCDRGRMGTREEEAGDAQKTQSPGSSSGASVASGMH